MKIYVQAKPKSKREYIKKIDDTHYIVAVNELPESGRANQAIIKSLSKYFNIKHSGFSILQGRTFKRKVIEIS